MNCALVICMASRRKKQRIIFISIAIRDEGIYAGLDFEVALQKVVFDRWIPDVEVIIKDGTRYILGYGKSSL